jgi:hypothetical protein
LLSAQPARADAVKVGRRDRASSILQRFQAAP